MKKIFLILLLGTMFYAANSQTRVARSRTSITSNANRFSLGLEAGIPFGAYGKPYSYLVGGSLQYEAMPDADLGLTVNAGYLHYPVKTSYGGGSAGFVPLLAGVKYYFTPGAFFHAQLGAAIGTRTGQGTSFAYAPGLGFRLSPNFDAELKYMGISNKGGVLNNAGLRIGYNF